MTEHRDPRIPGVLIVLALVIALGLAAWILWANATGGPPRAPQAPAVEGGK